MFKKTIIYLLLLILTACSDDAGRQDQVLKGVVDESPVKVLVVGFDGATWEMFKPAIEAGLMPRLKLLMEQGVHTSLKTIKPTITPIIWTTIATGKLPAVHGVESVVDRDPKTGQMKPLTSNSVKVKSIWDILSQNKQDVTVVRWPVTWPARKVNGELVTDFAFQTARKKRVWPDTLETLVNSKQIFTRMKDIEPLTGVNKTVYDKLDPLWQWKLMVLLREYVLDVQFKDIARSLFEKKQRAFTAVYFYSLDALGHNYYRFLQSDSQSDTHDFHDLVMNWCRLYDQFLTEILDAVDKNTYIVLCSDHGMELALKPQNYLIVSENSPPAKDQEISEVTLPPGPEFEADPFSMKLKYTAPSGQHVNKPDGIFVLSGPNVKKNWHAPSMKITQITPTILYLMGLPAALDFADQPRLDLFKKEYIQKHKIQIIETYEIGSEKPGNITTQEYDQEDDLLLNRLEALGYI